MKMLSRIGSVVLCAYAAAGFASVDNVGTYNLILQQDLNTSSDIEGRIMIGGNINMAGKSLDVGGNNGIPADPLVDAVTVVGDITANDVKTQNGNIVYGGSVGTTTLINNGTGSAFQMDQGLLQTRFDTIYQSVINDSDYYQTLTANGTFNTSDMNKKLFESSSADDLLVFNISGSDLLSGGIEFGFTPSVPMIINVSGTGTLDINAKAQGNFSKETVSPLVLWNFYDYTALNFNGDGWNGSVLAPYANITSYTGSLDGGIAAVSYTGGVEVHNKLFTYEPPEDEETPVSAPSAVALLFGGLWLVMRSRRKQAVA